MHKQIPTYKSAHALTHTHKPVYCMHSIPIWKTLPLYLILTLILLIMFTTKKIEKKNYKIYEVQKTDNKAQNRTEKNLVWTFAHKCERKNNEIDLQFNNNKKLICS